MFVNVLEKTHLPVFQLPVARVPLIGSLQRVHPAEYVIAEFVKPKGISEEISRISHGSIHTSSFLSFHSYPAKRNQLSYTTKRIRLA